MKILFEIIEKVSGSLTPYSFKFEDFEEYLQLNNEKILKRLLDKSPSKKYTQQKAQE